MVNRFHVAVVNKEGLAGEASKRFADRKYSKSTLKNYVPNVKKAIFVGRKGGFSIYEVPLKKVKKQMKLKKGDKVKIVTSITGFGEYGLRKGSIGYIMKSETFRNRPAYQVDFPNAGKELTMYAHEIRKVR